MGRRGPHDDRRTGRAGAASTQLAAVSEHGEVLLEPQAETRPEELGRVVSGTSGPRRVVFEEGPLSGPIRDALKGVAREVVAADPGAPGAGLLSGALTRPADEERAHRPRRGPDRREGRAGPGDALAHGLGPSGLRPGGAGRFSGRRRSGAHAPGRTGRSGAWRGTTTRCRAPVCRQTGGRRHQGPREGAMPQKRYTLQGTRGLPLRRAARGSESPFAPQEEAALPAPLQAPRAVLSARPPTAAERS